MSTVEYAHVTINPDNVPMIAGTQIKVVEVALDHVVSGWDAAEIQRQHPHLTLGQIYSALAYYYDHKAEVDEDMERRERHVEDLKAQLDRLQGPSTLRAKLKESGHLP